MFGFQTQQTRKQPVVLYAVVFGNAYVKLVTVMILFFFAFNPVLRAEANEAGESSETVSPPVEKVIAEVPAKEPPPPPEVKESDAASVTNEEPAAEEATTAEPVNETPVEADASLDARLTTEESGEPETSEETEPVASESGSAASESVEADPDQATTQTQVEASQATVNIDKEATTSNETSEATDQVGTTTTHNEVTESSDETEESTSQNSNHSADDTGSISSGTTASSATTTNLTKQGEETETVDKFVSTTTVTQSEEELEVKVKDPVLINEPPSQFAATTSPAFSSTSSIVTVASSSTAEEKPATTTLSLEQAALAINDSNRHQFAESECRAVGDGSFYCSETSNLPHTLEDGVFAATDSDGYLEIFVSLGGETIQLTHNQYDDSSPYYDEFSEQIVWHALIHDRYQIMAYDLTNREVRQITDTTYNNMEPMAYGKSLFWQAWIQNNWEIIRLEDNQIIQMTDNEVHDISPYAQDDYLMWQTQDAAGWKTTLYDLNTGRQELIDVDTDGITKNPRLILMYESHDANGDVRVMGYDLKNKKYISLAQVPTSLPPDLPEPTEDEEERALIQAKPAVRETKERTNDDITLDPKLTNSTSTNVSTTTADLVIPALSETAATSSINSIETLDLSDTASRQKAEAEVDRLLEAALAKKAVEHIDDVVIPPLATSSDETVG